MSMSASFKEGGVTARPCFAKAGAPAKAANAKAVAVQEKPSLARLAQRNPIAILSLVSKEVAMFLAGGVSGALAKTTTAPLDRLKILLQTSSASSTSAAAQATLKGGPIAGFVEIAKSEGIGGYWRGNIPQLVRVLPYSACQLYAYDQYKKLLSDKNGELDVPRRLASGALAACTATTITYPLDIVRLRLAVDPTVTGMGQVIRQIIQKEGMGAFYKGLVASWAGIAPYSALNFACFDLLKKALPGKEGSNTVAASLIAAGIATGSCYPLDTVRRQMQLKTSNYKSVPDAFVSIVKRDGLGGIYKGFIPNALKNLPNQSIRLSTFDSAKGLLVESEAALKAETAALAAEKKGGKAAAPAKGKAAPAKGAKDAKAKK